MKAHVGYDESVDILVAMVRDVLGADAFTRGVVLREAGGKLAFFSHVPLSDAQRGKLGPLLVQRLGQYARTDRVLAARGDVGAAPILDATQVQWIEAHGMTVRYLDRRIVGADWLEGPDLSVPSVPRVVFASLKGGVGRTTALCVAAAELARQGRNVLAVDLDLEAAGLGTMLLPQDAGQRPRYGVLDYLVELSVSGEVDPICEDMKAASSLDVGHSGRVDVVPAYGTMTRPEHYLGKLSRAMLDTGPDGEPLPVRSKVARMVDALAPDSYDVVLLDARAGLAELTAGPLLALSATLLLFSTAQQQSIEDMRLLLAHLHTLIRPGQESPWQTLQCILAKATPNSGRNAWFIDEVYKLFQDHVYEAQEGLEGFNFHPDDRDAPHYPVPIAFNPLFADWDPSRSADDLTQPFYENSFRPFLDAIVRRLDRPG